MLKFGLNFAKFACEFGVFKLKFSLNLAKFRSKFRTKNAKICVLNFISNPRKTLHTRTMQRAVLA